ncbi:MAG TPA: hypothetical protein PKK26_00705 [Candidatus Wallbacteria bacterium]|nr:hypothetical protein [Candidatus Wallbacteria bacterium]
MRNYIGKLNDLKLGPEVLKELSSFLEGLSMKMADDDFKCFVLYGDVLKEDFSLENSPVNILIIASEVTVALLERIQPIAARAISEIRLEPLIVTYEEMVLSADVFPVKYLEIKKNYRILEGDDLIAGFEIPAENIRLHCEQEMRSFSLKLRNDFLACYPDAGKLGNTLFRYIPDLLSLVKFFAEFTSGQSFPKIADSLNFIKSRGVAIDPLSELIAIRKSQNPPGAAELKQNCGRLIEFMNNLTKLAE